MNDDIAIKVEGVYKDFKLPHEKKNSIKSIFTGIHKKTFKTYETQHALKNIGFEVKKGEFFGIVGRNGSGKSTLLKILAEIYQPTKGSVKVNGRLVPFIELGVGFNPELTGRENVYLNGALLGFSTKEIDELYDEIVEFAELEQFMDQKLKNYSSGMQVRLAFSVATRAKADILLIDEVLAVGDADFQRKCFNYFKELKRKKKTVVFVSHDMNAVKEFCDRAVLIDNSELVKTGKSEAIANSYSKLFMNLQSNDSTEDDGNGTGRYGTDEIKIGTVELSSNNLTDADSYLEVTVSLTAAKDLQDVVFGFSVVNAEGEAICGSNSQIKNSVIKKIKESSTLSVVWTCENIFADGKHTVTVAAHSTDGVTTYDWWPRAALFTVRRTERTPFKISPTIDLKIDNIDG